MLRRAVFLDRDGVLNEDPGYLCRADQLRVFPFAGPAVRRLNRSGWLVVVVSNQSAVARGLCTREDVERVNRALAEALARDAAVIDRFYYCPHHPRYGSRTKCDCRKPGTGMLTQAFRELAIDPARSCLVGDKTSDLLAGQRAGLRTVLVKTGQGGGDAAYGVHPDAAVADLGAAVDWIVANA